MSFYTSAKSLPCLTGWMLLGSLALLAGSQQSQGQEKKASGKVERKTYDFKEAGKAMEYALFVPGSYDKTKKTPLVVALHGLGGNPQQMMRSRGLTEQAEKHGYIVVAPMGYNSSGWYGAQGTGRGFSGRPGVSTPPGSVLPPRLREGLNLTEEQKKKIEEIQKEVDASLQKVLTEDQRKKLKENPGRGVGGGQDSPENLGELSEKDVMNVLALVRKEFNVDEKRIYLIGHSMGGAGTYHLGSKYPEVWAGLGPIAAAAGAPRNADKLKNIPVIVVHGDNDTTVPVARARSCVQKLKELNIVHEYLEVAGAGHGDIVGKGMPKIFEYFEKQHKERTKGTK